MPMTSPQHSSNDAAFMKFWQRYLRDQARYGTRVLHFVGNCFAVVALVLGVVRLDPVIPIVGVLIGYVFAWTGHVLVEHNRPSMAAHPVWSFICDVRMFRLWIGRRLDDTFAAIDDA